MSDINPYESTTIAEAIPSENARRILPFSISRSLLVWMFVCWVSAAPSFYIAMSAMRVIDWSGMMLGVMTFVAGYVFLDFKSSKWQFRRSKPVRYALRTTYIIRILISVIFPAALFVDMMCGMLSSFVLYPFGFKAGGDLPFIAIYLWTLSQGLVLNAVIAIVWTVLFVIYSLALSPETSS